MREVVISARAQKNIANLFEYLELKWSVKVREEFARKLHSNIKLIQINPEIFPISNVNPKYNKCVITKQSTLFYRYDSTQIRILSLFDTRQNPTKVNKIK